MASLSTGYGPRNRLLFDGDETKYELWEVKFTGHLRIKELLHVLDDDAESSESFDEDNALVFSELTLCLDDKSLSLIIYDAKDNGKEAINILRAHYIGTSKPRIIALYTELTSLKMASSEAVIDYIIRAEKAATSLKNAGEVISDSLLIAMVLKGLPENFKAFSTVVTQKSEQVSFLEFKTALRSYEESEKSRTATSLSDNVMKLQLGNDNIVCYNCGKPGHKKYQCKNSASNNSASHNSNRWCSICKSKSHDTKYCRKKNSTKSVSDKNDSQDSFAFKSNVLNKSDVNSNSDNLLVDCGATVHIINDKSKFIKFDDNFDAENHTIELADGTRTTGIVTGKGNAKIDICDSDGNIHNVVLEKALCVPSYKQNIFSVQAATENGSSVNFTPSSSELKAPNGTTFNIIKSGKLYYFNNVRCSNSTSRSLNEWHRTMGHCNLQDILKLECIVDGMKITNKEKFQCKTCIENKLCETRNRESDTRASKPLELVYCDLAGPISPISKGNYKYAACFVDDFSGLVMVYCIKQKSDAIYAARKFFADSAPYGTVTRFRTDNGTEFTNSEFKELMIDNKIKQEFTAPYSAHQNGSAERSWRSLFEMARCLLSESTLPKSLWNYALQTAAYIRNRCYNSRTKCTPYELFTQIKPNISNMYPFGITCFAYLQDHKKLDQRSEECKFIGYDGNSPAYVVYVPGTQVIKRVRCVKFAEDVNDKPTSYDDYCEQPTFISDNKQGRRDKDATGNESPVKETSAQSKSNVRYPMRERRKPKYLEDYETDCDEKHDSTYAIDYCYRMSDIPMTYHEAISSSASQKWQQAMEEEIKSLEDNDTYELTTLPEGRRCIGGKWVYNIKPNPNGDDKFKARYVAKGYSQIKDIDYTETFSPTAKITSIRMIMQLAAQEDLIVHAMDVKTAYLNADIQDEIYVQQPEGFIKSDPNCSELVLKLNKSLYGLKQSSKNWNSLLHSTLLSQNFKQSLVDYCVYTRFLDSCKVIILIWVDDIIIASNNINELNSVKSFLNNKFKMTDLNQLLYFLGIHFEFNDGCVTMDQRMYLEKIIDRFGMNNCNPKSTPCDLNVNKLLNDCDSEVLSDGSIYREIVGSLIYAMSNTRPDLAFIVTKLAQYMSKPTKAHLSIAKHTLKYIKGTLDYNLKFCKSENSLNLIGYSDSDWGGSDDRKSISGYCFVLNKNGPLISWKSRKQATVSLSTCEAEYVAVTSAVRESKFLKQLYFDLSNCAGKTINLFVDNQSAINLANNPVYHQRSKHIDIKYHFIRSEVQKNTVKLLYVPSNENIADLFTKSLSKIKLHNFSMIRGCSV